MRLFIGVAMTIMMAMPARAELVIEITRGIENPIKIAVVPFRVKSTGAFDVDLARLIEANLERSGQFRRVDRDTMLSLPGPDDQIFYRDWRAIDSEYTVVGSVEQDDQGLLVRYGLHNVYGEKLVFPIERLSESSDSLRDIGHYISDRIYESLTGIKGIFSTRLLYVSAERRSEKDQTFKLILSDADGGRPQVIFQSSEPILSPAWSPDGSRVAYMSFKGKRAGIYVQTLASGEVQKVSDFPGLNSAPSFSPDGRKLVMTLSRDGNPEVYVANLRTGELERMTKHFSIDTEASWSPDGRSILFTSSRGGKPQLYMMNLADKTVKRVTFDGDYNSNGAFTPDGDSIVFVHRTNERFHIARMNLKTREIRILTETDLDESPSVAPNGTMLIYATSDEEKGLLGLVSMDGRVRVRLPSVSESVREPAWSPFFN
ncbi:MAG: Tol-Pal system beta propeller repeat protein TolB [Gammaproteobacteria bacterium]|nr:Tol-Pal system beta propeller repeat protein TolB [Gammaproteobacteria bacterium]|tara:strand:+ start:1016 stop:2305 length:1290 start_codon:yes stop_codon:yes gene_type:complete